MEIKLSLLGDIDNTNCDDKKVGVWSFANQIYFEIDEPRRCFSISKEELQKAITIL